MEDDQSIDFLLLMEPPQDGTWWADGPGGYGGDEQAQDALTRGKVPNQAVVREEFDLFERALGNAGIMYGVMPYPTDLDGRVNGDAVFVRDHAVVDRHARKFLAAHFNDQAAARQAEVPYTCRVLQALGLEPIHYEKSPEVRIEGGEVVHGLLPSGKPFLITGVYRNTDMGNKMIQEMFGVHPEDHLVIETDAFHVDTSGFAVERRVNGTAVLVGYVFAPDVYDSDATARKVRKWCAHRGVKTLELGTQYTAKVGGSEAINAVPYVNGDAFVVGTEALGPKADAFLKDLNQKKHVRSPLGQRKEYGSGGANCSIQNLIVAAGNVYDCLDAGLLSRSNVGTLYR